MKLKELFRSFASVAFSVSAAMTVGAQNNYFQAVTNLNPVGYWPMHEMEAPAPGDIETNYGSLGQLGTGFYPDWVAGQASVGIKRGFPGALAGDTNAAAYFTQPNSNGGGTTNSLYLPHTSPSVTLTPPFSVECWFYGTNTHQGDVWSQAGYEGLNAGASGAGTGNVCGIRLYWNAPHITLYTYANGTALNSIDVNSGFAAGNWYHIVATDDGTNINLYINGNLSGTHAHTSTWYVPDSWTPFEVGAGRGNTRDVNAIVDEVAIYTNVIQDISDHYNAGINPAPAPSYSQLVMNDKPVVYYRMDSLPYTAPPQASWPVLTNFGSTGGNGVYTPGTIPGIMTGPASSNGIAFGALVGTKVPLLSGVSSYADVGNNAAFNPTGTQPFSFSALFRGYPCDNRVQNIVGHSDNSWRLAMNTNGKLLTQLGTNTTSVVNSAKVYNDSLWHHVVVAYTPGATPTANGTNSLYVDGVLDSSVSTVTPNGILPGSAADVLIAADPQYTNNAAGVGRQFAGQVCEVAAFTNSLTVGQVQVLYNALGIAPFITQQPVSGNVNQGASFTDTVKVSGSTPFSYQWYDDNAPLNTQTNASLFIASAQPGDVSTNYYVVISNSVGSVTSAPFSLKVTSAASIVTQFPQPYTNLFTIFAGASPTFSVTVAGAAPISTQWFTNGVAVSGATTTAYRETNVAVGPLNTYCIVSNSAGSVTSMVWMASVIASPAAPYPQAVLADAPVGYWRLNEGPNDGSGNNGVLSHDYAGGNDGIYTNVSLAQQGYNQNTDPGTTATQFGQTGISLINSFAGQIAGIDFAAPTDSSTAFSIEAWVNGFTSMTNGAGVVTKGYGNGGEQFDLDVNNNAFRFFVRDAAGNTHGPTTTFKTDGNWHHVVGVCDEINGSVMLYIDGHQIGNTAIAPGVGIQAATNLMSIGARMSSATAPNNLQFEGSINDVAIYNYALSSNQVLAHFVSAGVPPQFTALPPATVTANGGGPLTIPAMAVGSAPLSYQWYDIINGTNVAVGASNAASIDASLVVSNVPSYWNNYVFQLTVSNAYGTTNTTLTLTVLTNAPLLTADLPPLVLRASGSSFTYSPGIAGPPPYHYQWYNQNSPISGQTNATFTTTVGGVGSSTTYFVIITNVFGAVTSSVSTLTAVAPLTNSFATTLLQFSPAGYWPLQETTAPAPVTMETNYGTLGSIGNAYYAITTPNEPNVSFNQNGALSGSGDVDPSVSFTGPSGTNYAFVPRAHPALTLRAPFTMECWIYSTSLAFSDLISESGSGLNATAGNGNWGGPRLCYAGNNAGGPALQLYLATGVGSARPNVSTAANTLPVGQWHHCVASFDGGTTMLYVDGNLLLTSTALGSMAPDTWTPLTIGDGLWQGNTSRAFSGSIDEVAIYTNILTTNQVMNHYLAGTTPGSNYVQTVQHDLPMLYYRMDCAGFTNAPAPQCPVAVNYGSTSVDGAYLSGIAPGAVSGPQIAALGTNSLAAPINGIISCVDAGNSPSFNPTNTQSFTVMTWMRAYPSDGRVQTIMSHGTTNWAMNLDGTTGRVVWNTFTTQVTSSKTINDGEWHHLVGVSDGATSSLYVDGQLNSSAPLAAGLSSEPNAELYLGGNPDFVTVGGNQRYFAGALAHSAFFTTALTGAQIQQIVNAANSITPTLTLSLSSQNIVINYTGTLQSSTNALGPYTTVPGATSPYTVPMTGAHQFFRTSNGQ